jgi:hypothetical protein
MLLKITTFTLKIASMRFTIHLRYPVPTVPTLVDDRDLNPG